MAYKSLVFRGNILVHRLSKIETSCTFLKKKNIFERKMSTGKSGRALQEIVKRLEDFASKKLAEKWDNVGLLVEPSGSHIVKKIILTNDLTQKVLAEAIEKSANMIISYHPPIFVPLKRLSQSNWKERIVVKAAENRIAIYSPHTSFDAIKDGVNDWLISCFGPGDVRPITSSIDPSCSAEKPNGCFKITFTFKLSGRDPSHSINELMGNIDESKDIVTYFDFFEEDRKVLEVFTPPLEAAIANVYSLVFKSDIELLCSEVSRLEQMPLPNFGMGRTIQLKEPIHIQEAVRKIKDHLGIQHVRLALARKVSSDTEVKSIAVCAGSGGSVLKGVSADLYVTGEMSHHEVLHAAESGKSVILCEHSNTERGFLKAFLPKIFGWFNGDVEVEVSQEDKDPLTIV